MTEELRKTIEGAVKAAFGVDVEVDPVSKETLYNVVLVRQSGKDYLFQLPDDVMLGQWDKVICDTTRGQQEGVTSIYSIKVNISTLEWLAKYFGATLPLKPIVGTIVTKMFKGEKKGANE